MIAGIRVGGLVAVGIAILGVAVGAAPAVAAGPAVSAVADPAPVSPGTRLAAIAQPVVQLVQTDYAATITVPRGLDNKDAELVLHNKLIAQQLDGRLARDLQSINRQWLDALSKDIDTYYRPGPVLAGKATLSATCSGWFASPDGYLVTAAHCVTADPKALLAELAPVAMAPFIKADLEETLRNFAKVPLDAGMRQDMVDIANNWYLRHATLKTLDSTVSVHVAVQGQDLARDAKVVSAEVVSAGEPFPGRDVALLKVEGFSKLPSLPLGDDAALRVGDTIYIDGFPGTVAATEALSAVSRREPSFTEGPISAFRTTVKNVAYLQTQAPAYHGNSGGPVLNADGKVIGILIAGVADPQTGGLVAGQEFVLRRDSIAQELARHSVTAVASPTTTAYSAALDDFYRGYFARAKKEFGALAVDDPQLPYVAKYLGQAEQQLAAGNDRTPGIPWLTVGLAAGGFAVAVLVAVGVLLLVLLRRGRAPTTVGAVMPFAPPGLPSALPPPGPSGPSDARGRGNTG